MNRNLCLLEHEDGSVEAEFIKYPQYGTPYHARRLLMEKEVKRAKEVIESKDEFIIDNFCYSIA